MNRYQLRRQKRKYEHRCTRCSHGLPEGWPHVNCHSCHVVPAESTRQRRISEKGELMKLDNIPTSLLVEELERRAGVTTKKAEPHETCEVNCVGPAIVLVVTD